MITPTDARSQDGAGTAARRRRITATGILLASFAALTVAVQLRPRNALDDAVMRWATGHPWPPAVAAANVVVGLATPLLVGLATLLVVLVRDRGRLLVPLCRLALLGSTVVVLKTLTGRDGPALVTAGRDPILGSLEHAGHGVTTIAGAFPSGHTTTAVVCTWLVLRPATTGRRAAYLIWVALVSAGLIYLNFHWLTDVLGGWLWGAVLLTLPLRRRTGAAQRAQSSPCPAPSTPRSPHG